MPESSRHDRGKQAHSVSLLDLADRILKRLGHGLFDQPICSQIRKALAELDYLTSRQTVNAAEYDKKGTEIWNKATRLDRDEDSNVNKTLPLLRSFALALLHTAYQALPKKPASKPEATVRIMRTTLKAGKTCIEAGELALATEALQKAADHVYLLVGSDRRTTDSDQDPTTAASTDLAGEYWILRAMLSWKQGRLDLAESFLSKIPSGSNLSTGIAEKLADLSFEVGKELSKSIDKANAIRWLDRASEALETLDPEQLSHEAIELRTAILAELIQCLLSQNSDESLSRATDLVSFLEQENPSASKLGLHLLKIKLLEAKGSLGPAEYQHILMQMIQSTVLSPPTFKTIMHHVQKLHKISATHAQRALDAFLCARLFEHAEADLIEKAAVMRVWSAAQAPLDIESANSLDSLLQDVVTCTPATFSEEATHASQTLLWKCIESAISATHFETAERWCRLACHTLFVKAGDINKSKLSRKLMVIALTTGKLSVAREAFYQMPRVGQEASASQYLLYRTALREGDEALMNECLVKLVKAPEQDAQYLYACVQEAQRLGSKQQAVTGLQRVVEKCGMNAPAGVHLPTLLRCTIQMMLQELEQDASNMQTALSEVCQMLEGAVKHLKNTTVPDGEHESRALELEWFAKTSYNVALQRFEDLEPAVILRLLNACLSLMDLSMAEGTEETLKKLARRGALCHHLSASVAIMMARTEDHIETSGQHYADVLKHCSAFRTHATRFDGDDGDDVDSTAHGHRQTQIIRYEIEALLMLHRWDDLDEALERCLQTINSDHLDTLADLIITVHTVMTEKAVDPKHQRTVPKVMQGIINQSWRKNKNDMGKLSRWLRCVFKMTVDTTPETALKIVEQATGIASRRTLMQPSQRYPATELEWLASTAFNTAVDRYCASDYGGCRTLAEAALNLAQAASESPGLYAQMQGLWRRLQEQMQ
ncbi:hypothetical protein CAC42_4834 [Sphaceloma murrayae]|uniref:Protein ZIP4 homolog n=1 Tax=Sphaceloma murrayae TaxID=2082308 RepID=A0A2K1QPM2_9PEZI|nr:hypothetical protein CAC42_4834 [Sphaceloma murrayae]